MTFIRTTSGRVAAVALGLPVMLAGAAFGAFSLVGLQAHTSEHHHASYPWSGGTVSLDLGAGNAQIRAGDTQVVDVSYTEHYELKRPTAQGAAAAGGVSLKAHCPGGLYGSNCSINYVITVPKRAALNVHIGDGNLSLQGISAPVTARAGDGNISGSALASNSVQADIGDGSIHLQWVSVPTQVTSSVGDGSIDVVVPDGSGPYAIRQSGAGSSNIEVATDPGAGAAMVLHTGDGSIHVGYGG
ncbi:MAG TPA: hypothetical protein VHX15_17170 [Frankiaceae bacterium]|jgi:hypothetical protein|nr:hypothetical protein [Frankiaceae bacterium]